MAAPKVNPHLLPYARGQAHNWWGEAHLARGWAWSSAWRPVPMWSARVQHIRVQTTVFWADSWADAQAQWHKKSRR